MIRPLIVAAHGTASAAGRRVVQGCASAAARRLSVLVQVGYVDVCEPALESVVRPGSVVVPLFLASGYHVRHDVPAAVARTPGVSVTPALGVAAGVVEALAGRLGEAVDATSGVRPDAVARLRRLTRARRVPGRRARHALDRPAPVSVAL